MLQLSGLAQGKHTATPKWPHWDVQPLADVLTTWLSWLTHMRTHLSLNLKPAILECCHPTEDVVTLLVNDDDGWWYICV